MVQPRGDGLLRERGVVPFCPYSGCVGIQLARNMASKANRLKTLSFIVFTSSFSFFTLRDWSLSIQDQPRSLSSELASRVSSVA